MKKKKKIGRFHRRGVAIIHHSFLFEEIKKKNWNISGAQKLSKHNFFVSSISCNNVLQTNELRKEIFSKEGIKHPDVKWITATFFFHGGDLGGRG